MVMFTGIINAEHLCAVLQAGLIPFIREVYPDGQHLQQDNDPKHASLLIKDYFEECGPLWGQLVANTNGVSRFESH